MSFDFYFWPKRFSVPKEFSLLLTWAGQFPEGSLTIAGVYVHSILNSCALCVRQDKVRRAVERGITYIKTDEGFAYLAVVIDLYS